MMNRDLLPLDRSLAVAWPPAEWRDVTVVLAVSGGADSVALLRAMAAAKLEVGGAGRLIVAHFNHHLRPDADDDARFVAALAQQLNLQFELGEATATQIASPLSDGVEAAAREFRYAFLRTVAERTGGRYVVTAHTADDQIETVLFNVLRGTGLSGLAGIPRARPLSPAVSVIRPLLAVRRAEVLEFLNRIGQPYRVDATNKLPEFTRNRLRHELLPRLREQYNSDVDGALERLAKLAGDAQQLIERLAEELLDRTLSPGTIAAMVPATPGLENVCVIKLCTSPLKEVDRHLVREMFIALWRRLDWPLQDMGFAELDSLAEIALAAGDVTTKSRNRTFPGNVRVELSSDELVLTRAD